MRLRQVAKSLQRWGRDAVWEKVFVAVIGMMVIGAAAVGTPVSAADMMERLGAAGTAIGAASSDICTNEGVPDEVKKASGCTNVAGEPLPELSKAITDIVKGVISIMGLLAVIMIIVGAYKYMTAAGDASKLEAGRKTLLYACVGLIICALAFLIVNFVISNVIGQ